MEVSCINAVHNRACLVSLALGHHAPEAGVQGEMGWFLPINKQWMSLYRFCCRLFQMSDDIILRKFLNGHRISEILDPLRWLNNLSWNEEGRNWVLFCFQQFRSYCDEIETWYQEEIPYKGSFSCRRTIDSPPQCRTFI